MYIDMETLIFMVFDAFIVGLIIAAIVYTHLKNKIYVLKKKNRQLRRAIKKQTELNQAAMLTQIAMIKSAIDDE